MKQQEGEEGGVSSVAFMTHGFRAEIVFEKEKRFSKEL